MPWSPPTSSRDFVCPECSSPRPPPRVTMFAQNAPVYMFAQNSYMYIVIYIYKYLFIYSSFDYIIIYVLTYLSIYSFTYLPRCYNVNELRYIFKTLYWRGPRTGLPWCPLGATQRTRRIGFTLSSALDVLDTRLRTHHFSTP